MKTGDATAKASFARGAANRTQQGFLEICVDSIASARAALAGGADRLEVCSALALGGLTPSAGLLAAVVEIARPAGVSVRAMVRPRAGDFTYHAEDLEQAIAESAPLLREGADGLVFGALRGSTLCAEALIRWRDAVRRMPSGTTAGLTLHRAIDLAADPVAEVGTAIAIGFDQILSSGGARTAMEGASTLAAMAQQAGDACTIVAAAGVTPESVAALLAATGTRAIHASARARREGMPPIAGHPGFGQAYLPTDATVVRALRTALDKKVA